MSLTVRCCGAAVRSFITCHPLRDALVSMILSPLLLCHSPSPFMFKLCTGRLHLSIFDFQLSISHSFPHLSSSTSFLQDCCLHCLLASPDVSFCFSILYLPHASFWGVVGAPLSMLSLVEVPLTALTHVLQRSELSRFLHFARIYYFTRSIYYIINIVLYRQYIFFSRIPSSADTEHTLVLSWY
jgi:hypothetical protein